MFGDVKAFLLSLKVITKCILVGRIEMCNGKVNKDIKKNIEQQPRSSCFQNEVLSWLETIKKGAALIEVNW